MGLRRIMAVLSVSGGVSGVLWTNRDSFLPRKARAATFQFDEALERYRNGEYKWDKNWDHRAPRKTKAKDKEGEGVKEEEAKPVVAKRTLILIRHGQYEQWQGDPEKKVLTELGKRQAMAAGQRLRDLGEKYTFMYYSTMPRAMETAQIMR